MTKMERFYDLAGRLCVKALTPESKDAAIRYAADQCGVNLEEIQKNVSTGRYKPTNEQQDQLFAEPQFHKRK